MDGWGNFFVAEVGASAALAGLIFVAVSLNLSKILTMSRLPDRALQALVLLSTILILSSLMLVPNQPQNAIGLELVIIGACVCVFMTRLDLRIRRLTDVEYRGVFLWVMLLTQLATLPYVIAGIVVLAGNTNGLYIMVAGMLISFVKALLDAWVLLVEINR